MKVMIFLIVIIEFGINIYMSFKLLFNLATKLAIRRCHIGVTFLLPKNLVSKSTHYLYNLSWQWCDEVLCD